MKHTFDEKLEIVRLLEQGHPMRGICVARGLDHHDVLQWKLRYEAEGEEGLRGRNSGRDIAPQQRESIVREFMENSVPLSLLSLRYSVSRAALKAWIRKVREHGYSMLYGQGRNDTETAPAMPRPGKREPQTELEKLQWENLRLRAENALLKKVKALVEEEEARARTSGRRSSTD